MPDSTRPVNRPYRPLWLFRRWKAAAGPLAGWYIPSAPFTALEIYGPPQAARRERLNPARLDRLGQSLAEKLALSEQGQAVHSGEAAMIIDLPGAVSAGVGFFLQQAGIAPVLLFNGLYQPDSLVDGKNNLPAIIN